MRSFSAGGASARSYFICLLIFVRGCVIIIAVHSVDLLYTLWTGSESLRPIGSATVFYEWIRCLLVFICFVLAVTCLRICTIDGYEYIDNAGVIILVIFMIIMAFLPD